MIKELAKKNRSYRRFYEDRKITWEQLVDMIDCARYTACGGNKQTLRFLPVCDEKDNEKLFSSLHWAGYLPEWDGPAKGERPSAYIILLSEAASANATNWDEGIAAQTILLSAVEMGYGGCILANIDRSNIVSDFAIGDDYTVKLVIALGVPKEEVVIEDISCGDDIRYYRDSNQVHHVPKLRTQELIYGEEK